MQRILGVAVAISIVASGCGETAHSTDVSGPAARSSGGATLITGGAAGIPSGSGTGGSGGVPTAGNGATGVGGTPMSAGGVAAGGGAPSSVVGGGPGSGGALGAAGATGAGGANASGGVNGASGSYGNLAVFGNTTTLELAPVLLAAKTLYPGTATVANGGIPNLWTGADLATNAETQALVQSVTHSNLRTIFTVCEGLYRIVARRSAGITALADLRGKRIATLPGTSSAYFLHAMLATAQLAEADVTVVPLPAPTQLSGMLSRHEVDAATIWEPEIQNASDALASDAIEFQDKSVYRELFDLHTTAEKLANPASRRSIVEFLRVLVTASGNIEAQPSSVWPLVASTTGFDITLIGKSWKNEGFPGALVPDLLDVLEQEELWLAKTAGRTARTRADLVPLIDETPLKEALSAP